MIEQIAKTTFQKAMPSGDRVLIGNIDSKNFKPHLKLNRWGGECFIKVGLPVTERSLPIIEGDKITWEGRNRHIIMYPLAPTKQMELGGYEYEVVLEKKPKTNKIILDIQSQGLRFDIQPPLTQQEIEDGYFRPDNVVGAYVVSHITKGGLVTSRDAARGITTGHGFVIYRPKVIDAKGNWAWAEQYISQGKQIITTPWEFLENASYPIRHIAGDTFGYSTKGSSATAMRGRIRLTRGAPAGGNGTGDSVGAYMTVSATYLGRPVKGNIYDDGDDEDDVTTNLHADGATEEKTVPDGAWDDLETFNFSSPPSFTNGVYYRVTVWGDDDDRNGDPGGSLNIRYNSVGGEHYYYQILAYNGWPDPNSLSHSTGNIQSIYCTYTPGVGGEEKGPIVSSVIVGVLPSATRLLACERDSSVIIGDLVSATRALTSIRTASVINGVVASASRFVASTRTANVITGIVATTTRTLASIRTASVIIGVGAIASQARHFIGHLTGFIIDRTYSLGKGADYDIVPRDIYFKDNE